MKFTFSLAFLFYLSSMVGKLGGIGEETAPISQFVATAKVF